jgi:hypothetical protein
MSTSFRSVFAESWDVVVYGTGWAGFAAARELRAQGLRVLLTGREAALLTESGWAFCDHTGEGKSTAWRTWTTVLDRHGATGRGQIDGAAAEVLATLSLRSQSIPALYYVAPVAVERDTNGNVGAVWFGAKSGMHSLSAASWIDASETGELARLLDRNWRPQTPERQFLSLFCRHLVETEVQHFERDCPGLAGVHLRAGRSLWENEERLTVELPGDFSNPRSAWLPALRAWRETGNLGDGIISHGSVIPYRVYPAGSVAPVLPGNVLACGAAISGDATLAARFDSGVAAAALISGLPKGECVPASEPPSLGSAILQGDVGVAGLGTGGVFAAVAAARSGARVIAIEPLPFAGGIGTGGGINYYYYGIKGGLQTGIDERVREILPLIGEPGRIRGFHPEAKKIALEEMLAAEGTEKLQILSGSTVFRAERDGRQVRAVWATSPDGPVRLEAKAWVDATGDGDLAVMAGARHKGGREGDGLTLPYSQSSGFTGLRDGRPYMDFVNFAAGYCDPTDIEDLTRGRIDGICHYAQGRYQALQRPTYIAPAIGIRQSRHIRTQYTVSFDDLFLRRKFPDVVGYTGGHYDNHARDFEFESDKAAFWMWICREFTGRVACEIPFRILIPEDLDNLLIGCRAAGISDEAHHAFRMQRDMQRLGEIAGFAAALQVSTPVERAAEIPLDSLRQKLDATGAVRLADLDLPDYGDAATVDFFQHTPGEVDAWMEELEGEKPTVALWHLWQAGRHDKDLRERVAAGLDSPDAAVTWRSANLLTMWHDSRGEARLVQAILDREIGEKEREIKREHEILWSFVPRWYVAARFVRLCCTPACLPALESIAADPGVVLNVRSSAAIVCERLARQEDGNSILGRRLAAVLDALVATPAPLAERGIRQPLSDAYREGDPEVAMRIPTGEPTPREDYDWQLHLVVSRARLALGQTVAIESFARFSKDRRANVRKAFQALLSQDGILPGVRIKGVGH